jgi:hypothetical protein
MDKIDFRQLYDWLDSIWDDDTMDGALPFSAETPGEYTMNPIEKPTKWWQLRKWYRWYRWGRKTWSITIDDGYKQIHEEDSG